MSSAIGTKAEEAITRSLAARTQTNREDWFVVLKARHGMAMVLKALSEHTEPGRHEVVTQALTCVTAVNPILHAGLLPRYGDIDQTTMSVAPGTAPISATTAAVVIQHTFGIIATAADQELAAKARLFGALVLEDSAHCAGRMSMTSSGKPLADVSFHSFGVEKMLPTKFGAAVWLSPSLDPQLRAGILSAFEGLGRPGMRVRLAVASYRTTLAVLTRLPAALSRPLRAFLVAAGLFEPPIHPVETRGGLSPEPQRITRFAARRVEAVLADLDDREAVRARAASTYRDLLATLSPVPGAVASEQSLVRYPVLVPEGVNADAVVSALRARGVYAGTWYRPALFPGVADPALYKVDINDEALAVTRNVIARIVNLPTDVAPERARDISNTLLGVLDYEPSVER